MASRTKKLTVRWTSYDKLKRGDLLRAKWVDACSHTGWRNLKDEKDFDIAKIEVIGWIIKITPTYLTIANKLDGDSASDPMSIPRGDLSRIRIVPEWECE